MVKVKKREGEVTGSLIRRFSRSVQQSGILLEVRKKKFYQKPKNKKQRRHSALRKLELKKKYEQLKKLGKT